MPVSGTNGGTVGPNRPYSRCIRRHTMQEMQKTAPSTPHTPQDDLLTASDITRLLRIDKSTAYRMAEDGRLPGFKVGRQWRFRADDVAALLGTEVATRSSGPIDVPHAVQLAEFMASLYGVMVVITDMDGQPMTDVINANEYFTLLAEHDDVIAACTTEWRRFGEDQEFRPRLQDSHLGFRCARAFIRSGHELVGMVIAGGLAPTHPAATPAPALAAAHGVDRTDLDRAASALPLLDDRGEGDFLAALSLLARHISANTDRRSQS